MPAASTDFRNVVNTGSRHPFSHVVRQHNTSWELFIRIVRVGAKVSHPSWPVPRTRASSIQHPGSVAVGTGNPRNRGPLANSFIGKLSGMCLPL